MALRLLQGSAADIRGEDEVDRREPQALVERLYQRGYGQIRAPPLHEEGACRGARPGVIEVTGKGGTVTFDAKEYLQLLDDMAKLEKKLRNLGKDGYNFRGSTPGLAGPASREKKEEQAMQLDLDISGIDWKLPNNQGGGPAGPGAGWSWAFAYTKDGGIRRETLQLVQALEQYGTVRIGQYEISLGGREGKLLNRKRI